jgi:PhnB protein
MREILGLQPRLVVEGADAALAFYTAAFGGEVTERYVMDGRVVHSTVTAGPIRFAVKDAGDGDAAPSGGGVPVIMSLDVTDADAVAERMIAAGATVIYPVSDHDYGDRGGRLADPFGHQWMIAQHTEQLTPDEVQSRLDAMS